MDNHLVGFLDSGGDLLGNQQFDVRQAETRSTVPAQKSNRTESEFFCLLEGTLDVLGFTAGGQRDQQIAGCSERPDLPGEQFRMRVVVADGGQ